MNWPNHTDYQDSIQNPQTCFQDDELRAGTITCDMLGLPRVMSGNFASVYEMNTASGRWAIRCFVRQVSGQQARYTVLSKHLSAVQLDSLVKFEFIPKGIRVRSEWYPIVKMQWVKGVPMQVYVDEMYGDAAAMQKLAAQWRELLAGLRTHQIAHGDLQHGNVMVTPEGEFRLVDYDGMYVPGFGRGRSPELGHTNFQHPRRTPDYYEVALDNFSALSIYLSFLALAHDPKLWNKYFTGDNLIFVGADYQSPQNSKVFKELKECGNEKIQMLAGLLEWCCLRPMALTPDFAETMKALDEGKLPVDLAASTVAPVSTTPPDWMKADEPKPKPVESPVADASKPVTTSPWSGSRASEPYPAQPVAGTRPAPVAPPNSAAPLNIWAFAAVAVALLTFIPAFRVYAGIAASVCGVIGFLKAQPPMQWTRWLAALGVLIGAGMMVMGFLMVKPSPQNNTVETIEEEEAAPTRPPAAAAPATKNAGSVIPAERLNAPVAAPVRPSVDFSRITPLGVLPGHKAEVETVMFSPDGRWLATGSLDETVKVWEAQTGELKHTLAGHTDGVASITFLPDNRSLVTVALDNSIRLWDLNTGELKKTTPDQQNSLWAIGVSPDGKTLAGGVSNRRIVRLLDFANGAVKRTLPEQSSWVRGVDFSPDSRWLATSCYDDSVRVWDLLSGELKQTFTIVSNTVESVAFSSTGTLLAAGSESRTIKIFETASGKLQRTLTGHLAEVRAVAFSPDARFVISGSADKSVRIWPVTVAAPERALAGHTDAVIAVAWSPNGQLAASAGADRTVRLWNVSSLKP